MGGAACFRLALGRRIWGAGQVRHPWPWGSRRAALGPAGEPPPEQVSRGQEGSVFRHPFLEPPPPDRSADRSRRPALVEATRGQAVSLHLTAAPASASLPAQPLPPVPAPPPGPSPRPLKTQFRRAGGGARQASAKRGQRVRTPVPRAGAGSPRGRSGLGVWRSHRGPRSHPWTLGRPPLPTRASPTTTAPRASPEPLTSLRLKVSVGDRELTAARGRRAPGMFRRCARHGAATSAALFACTAPPFTIRVSQLSLSNPPESPAPRTGC